MRSAEMSCRAKAAASGERDVQRTRICIELGHRAQWERPLIVDMSEWNAGDGRHTGDISRFAEHVIEWTRARVVWVRSIGELPERDPREHVERAAHRELHA